MSRQLSNKESDFEPLRKVAKTCNGQGSNERIVLEEVSNDLCVDDNTKVRLKNTTQLYELSSLLSLISYPTI